MMKRVAEFEKVSFEQFKKDWIDKFGDMRDDGAILQIYNNVKLPKRATTGSAGHDISIPFPIAVAPTDTLMIPTGIRCKMARDYVMLVFVRSSVGIKKHLQLVNQTGVIDSDYYNADNEGHLFVCLKNEGNDVVQFLPGDNIVQAVFVPFGVADTEEVTEERTGGIGSTTRESKNTNHHNAKWHTREGREVNCACCNRVILDTDNYCQYCGKPNQTKIS